MKWEVAVLLLLVLTVTSAKRDVSFFNFTEEFTMVGERHVVETADGYLLGIYHIPYGKKCGAEQPRKAPVLIMHGLGSNAVDFLIMGEDDCLGYMLADNCYDVWLGNSRGNFESKEHISFPSNSSEFWKFSWHEMGVYDVPAVIDLILEQTQQPKVHYIGHSQGTTQFFVYSSTYPDDSFQKVASMHALAPIAFMENMTSPLLRYVLQNVDQIEFLFNLLGHGELLPPSDFLANLGGKQCTEEHPNAEKFCENLIFIICGYDSSQWDEELFPLIFAHDPAGSSTRDVIQYAQEIQSGHFRQYDHGTVGNILHYGQAQPPDYDIGSIRVPLYLHYSDNDWLASTLDVERFAAEVPSSTLLKVPLPTFNHLDYLWAINVTTYVYDPLLAILDTY